MTCGLSFRKILILSLIRPELGCRSIGIYGSGWACPDDPQAVSWLAKDLGELRIDDYVQFDVLAGAPTRWEQELARNLGLSDFLGVRYYCGETRRYGAIVEDLQALLGDLSGDSLASELEDVFGYSRTEIPSIVESRRCALKSLNDGVGRVVEIPQSAPEGLFHNPWIALSDHPSNQKLHISSPLTLSEVFLSSLLAKDSLRQRRLVQAIVPELCNLSMVVDADRYEFVRTLLFDFTPYCERRNFPRFSQPQPDDPPQAE